MDVLPSFLSLEPWRATWRRARARALAMRDTLAPTRATVDPAWFTSDEVAGYDASFAADDPARIDDATWRDLDADALLARIAGEGGIYARQYLHHRLRRGARLERGRAPAWAGDAGDARDVLARTRRARAALGREDMEVTGLLFHDRHARLPAALAHARWLALLWLAGVATMLCASVALGAVLVATYFVAWGAIEIRFHARLQAWTRQRRAVLAMLRAIVDLAAVARAKAHPVLEGVAAAGADALRLLVALDLDATERHPIAADYANLLTLRNYAVAPARLRTFERGLPTLRALYAALAECEGRLCLLAHLQAEPHTCWARAAGGRELELVDLRNPLLAQASPLSVTLRGAGAFLTGENGVGKSTLLRAIGLNLLAARAFGFCYAGAACVPALPVVSSMAHEDSLAIGDSLYMAEMRRAQALLRVARRPGAAVFLVDEIFRGTNHVESVACAAAVLHRLAADNLLVASSHNVVLAPLLRDRADALRLVRADDSTLRLEPGVLAKTNGIEMMRRFDLDDSVRDDAQRVHDWFAGHVTLPAGFPTLAG